MVGIELTTSPLPRVCSTTELHGPTPRDSTKRSIRRTLDVIEATRVAHHRRKVRLDHARHLAQVGHIVRRPLVCDVDNPNLADLIVLACPQQVSTTQAAQPVDVLGALSLEVVEQLVETTRGIAPRHE